MNDAARIATHDLKVVDEQRTDTGVGDLESQGRCIPNQDILKTQLEHVILQLRTQLSFLGIILP